MVRIFFWAADSSGCAYYRCELSAAQLAKRGHEVLVNTVMPPEWLNSADIIVGQRVCQPGVTARWQRLAKEGRVKLVYEIDDDLLDIDHWNGPAHSFFGQPEIRANVIRNIEAADLVTVSTAQLAEVVSEYNRNVAVLPNCIPEALLTTQRPVAEQTTIGWSGGASHKLDLAELGSALTQFIRRYPEVGLHIIGDAKAASQLTKGINERARFTPWVESVPDFHAVIDFDITLAPLRPSKFNRSKSHIRPLEAAALGIPVVASDFGPYAEFVRHGETGLLVKRPHEWSKYLRQLLDSSTRLEMGANARKLAQYHTIEHNIELWEKALCI